MKPSKLYSYTIMPLLMEHLEEICQDIKMQVDSGIASCALFSMTLVPEGNPPANKAKILCQKYAKFKKRLDELGVESGILVQATVGHGWILGDMFPYQPHVNFTDGIATRVACPCDEGFKQYIYDAIKTVAEAGPGTIMIDDDFRLIWFKGEGCACPLHMERFNREAGTELTGEELWKAVNERTPLAKKYTDIFIKTQKESLLEGARLMRDAIDSVDPTLHASYCCCGNNAEFASEIATILAGKGNPVMVRINNGNYTHAGPRYFSRVFHRCRTQIEKLKGKVDIILAETDTCPQNRYSTSASSLHTHFIGSILEGANGAKHWITRLLDYEPQSGVAYRKKLSTYHGFYERLNQLTPSLKWRGCRIHTPCEPDFTYGRVKEEWDGWSYCVLEKMGIPMYFSGENGGVCCLEGDVDTRLSDEKILDILKGPAFIASDTAKNLVSRGFSQYLGVDVREWTGKQPVNEYIKSSHRYTKIQMQLKELIPLYPEVEELSEVLNTTDHQSYERLFPGVTSYKNSLGGQIFVFAGTPVAEFHLSTAFSFLNYSRKEQLIGMLKRTAELPLYFPGDEEVYLKCADMDDQRLFAALFNLGLDPIDQIKLVIEREVKGIEVLLPNGSTQNVAFTNEGSTYTLNLPLYTLEPVILFIK
ncbi:MAG: hypothetical protein IJ309_00895 [Clostridia bacterium]|nr:hypothetical protein [Clostridia bacterium]